MKVLNTGKKQWLFVLSVKIDDNYNDDVRYDDPIQFDSIVSKTTTERYKLVFLELCLRKN